MHQGEIGMLRKNVCCTLWRKLPNDDARQRLLARQVLIWGLPMDPIFADGAAKLRSRAAPSARIEPQILFLTDHYWIPINVPRFVPEDAPKRGSREIPTPTLLLLKSKPRPKCRIQSSPTREMVTDEPRDSLAATS